jgi:YD repeat-containing protein
LSIILPATTVATADTVNYEYDELGRLIVVERVGASVSTYDYDAGGNREQTTVALTPGVPASISVPASSSGTHTISWTAGSGTVTAYELYQSNSSNFSGQISVYSGAGTSTGISVQSDGTYYYRVRACNGSVCSGYRPGSNGVSVTMPPGTPTSITVPSSSTTGNFTISWGEASTGTVTAYRLYEATTSNFSGQVLVHDAAGTSKALSGRGNGTYYYRVRACNASGCSGYRTGGNALSVTLPPGTPASISVPSTSTTGSYTISWGSASGTVTAYKLYEATNSSFSGQTLVHSGTATSKALSGRGNGTYYYRVRACNGPACGGYRTGGNPTTVTLPPGVPASISVPSSSNTGNYTISWGSSSGNVTAYKLYEATNSSFSGQTLVYSGTGTSKPISGKSNGAYYYRIRACNGSSCSGYRTGANPTTVTLPPEPPATISGPFQSSGSYTISWASSDGATRYELWESKFGGGFFKVYDGPDTAKSFNSKPAGDYDYKAKACNAGGCSGFSPTRHVTVCNGPCLGPESP